MVVLPREEEAKSTKGPFFEFFPFFFSVKRFGRLVLKGLDLGSKGAPLLVSGPKKKKKNRERNFFFFFLFA